MIRKNFFISLILIFAFFSVKTNCSALDFFRKIDVDDNNILNSASITSDYNAHKQEIEELIKKTEQLEAKIENDQSYMKDIRDKKRAEYIEAKRNFNYVNKQLKAIRSINKKLQRSF